MTARLAGKIAMITGAGSGIGRAAGLTFAREGAHVILADRNLDAAEAVARSLRDAGSKAEAVAIDVTQGSQVEEVVTTAAARHGRLDILVNNAGFGISGSVVDTDEAQWDSIMNVNVKGVFFGCKYAIPLMAAAGGGAIVNTASTTANVGIRDRAAYCASKGAVAALTRAMALDHVGQNIRINAVAPGTIDSPYFTEIFAKDPNAAKLRAELEARQAMNRLGQPQEIANAMLFLASDEASFCTGSLMLVDGGWTAQ